MRLRNSPIPVPLLALTQRISDFSTPEFVGQVDTTILGFRRSHLVRFGSDDADSTVEMLKPFQGLQVECGGADFGINEQQDRNEVLSLFDVFVQHLCPSLLFGFGYLGEAVAGAGPSANVGNRGRLPQKAFSSRVAPGDFDVFARALRCASALMSDDFPTLLRPTRASSAWTWGRSAVLVKERRKRMGSGPAIPQGYGPAAAL